MNSGTWTTGNGGGGLPRGRLCGIAGKATARESEGLACSLDSTTDPRVSLTRDNLRPQLPIREVRELVRSSEEGEKVLPNIIETKELFVLGNVHKEAQPGPRKRGNSDGGRTGSPPLPVCPGACAPSSHPLRRHLSAAGTFGDVVEAAEPLS